MNRASDHIQNAGRSGPVSLDSWASANLPRLHPTRRKVLASVAALASSGKWTTSSEVREQAGLSQQLLNRHLRALESQGLIRLEHAGPGLPLEVTMTGAGQRVLGLGAQARTAPAEAEAAPKPAYAPPAPEAEPKADGERLTQALIPYIKKLDPEALERMVKWLVAEAAGKRSAIPAAAPQAEEDQAKTQWVLLRPVAPQLSGAEQALESRLTSTTQHEYRHLPWHKRTRLFANEWDQSRRKRLGLLNTYFTSFEPRWERPDWTDFNYGRRQADAREALYGDWIHAQFERLAPQGEGEVLPEDLHGDDAVNAYLDSRPSDQESKGRRHLGPPPYAPNTFNLNNPEHAGYAEELLDEIEELSRRIFGDQKEGTIRLLTEAVRSGKLPVAALDLRPQWKEVVISAINPAQAVNEIRPEAAPAAAPAQAPAAAATRVAPSVII